MSPSAASVDTRAPSDPNSVFNFNHDRCSFNSGASSSFSSINNNNQSSVSGRVGLRSRPRLVKQRRSCKTTTSSFSADAVDSGINPFRSVCSTNAHLNDFSNCSDNNAFNGQFRDENFVFRVSNSNNGVSHSDSSMNNNNNNHVSNGADFVFGVSNTDNGASDCNGIKNDSNIRNGADVIGAQFNNECFIFGGLNFNNNKGDDCNLSNNVSKADVKGSNLGGDTRNVDSIENVSVEKEKVGEIGSNGIKPENGTTSDDVDEEGKGKHGESGTEFALSEELKKLKIERNERDGLGGEKPQGKSNVGLSNGSDQIFVFTSAGGKSDVPRERSTPVKSEASSDVSGGWFTPMGSEASAISSNEDDKSVNTGETSRLKPHFTSDKVFVFGSSGNSTSARDSTPQSFSFSAEDGGSVKDVPLSLFSSPILDAEVDSIKPEACSVSEEKKAGCSSASMAQSSVASFPEFKLPQFDGSFSFSSNLPSELGRKTESRVRARGLRDKHSKKTKAKVKHSKSTKQQPVEIPLSAKSVTQVQDAAECYSPMDFSPYEETTITDDVSLIGQEATGQSKVENGGISGLAQPSPLFMKNGLGATMDAPDSGSSAKVNNNDENVTPVAFTTDVASDGQEKFAFKASSSAQNDVTSQKRQQKKKYRMKSASIPVASSTAQGSSLGGTHPFNAHDGLKGNFSTSTSRGKHEAKGNREQSHNSALSSAEKACDKWRRRGNDAYEKGDLSKAEDFYTWGVNCIPLRDASDVFAPLVRCYSNRAATRMALGRVREAVQDCRMAVKLDPTFHRAQMRAANCYLQLGELEDAMKCFGNVIESSKAVCLDRQVIISASEGIRKSEKVIECSKRSAELLRLKTSEAAASALDLIVEAMSVSIYSEKLLEMKAEALCMLRRHDEAIALCHQTRDFAGENFAAASSDNHEADDLCSDVHGWRGRALYKCHFHIGKLEEALEYIKKEESGAKPQESSDTLAATIGELLREKSAGNTAFQSGKHIEAIEHYTTAITSSMESRPFAAICFCNRAAAHQALGHIADAISDCSLAIALDEAYAKAVSRRATLHEMIRDFRQAAIDLQRLISLLEKQSMEKSKQSGSGNGKELRQVRHRLSMMEEEAKRDIPLDLYLILGVNKSDPASEIKKAYRKAALRHHPDKAGQSLVRSDVGDEGRQWNDIAELVHKDSDRLFKMIGEAYAVLSDPTKREEYDEEEEMRKALKESNNIRSSSRRYSEHYYQGFPFERSSNRRNWQDSYRTYTNSYRRY
ncbi:uncharacterized protein LOC141600461 [Silene latifolia]|uniref:uncharacterized protein LOC141600461 n=1 Tax=Silene latifolia TaxID=37657 RepID=UPI003D789600